MKTTRAWYGKIQWPGLKACYAGTLHIDAKASDGEVHRAFVAYALEFVPAGFAVLELIPGQVICIPEDST